MLYFTFYMKNGNHPNLKIYNFLNIEERINDPFIKKSNMGFKDCMSVYIYIRLHVLLLLYFSDSLYRSLQLVFQSSPPPMYIIFTFYLFEIHISILNVHGFVPFSLSLSLCSFHFLQVAIHITINKPWRGRTFVRRRFIEYRISSADDRVSSCSLFYMHL